VDCLLVRTTREGKKECLLVLRSSEPVKGVWWLPGGRLLKGESFFAAAKRKAMQETGLTNVTCVQVLGVWNTFFPTSNWDTDKEKGTQTVNPIVLVELNDAGADVKLDDTSEEVHLLNWCVLMVYNTGSSYSFLLFITILNFQWRWIGLDPQEAIKNGEDKYVVQALFRLQAWNPSYNK
jgi:ADP-ribose pyrophosphatase YjhB (NUDIX family)